MEVGRVTGYRVAAEVQTDLIARLVIAVQAVVAVRVAREMELTAARALIQIF
jgi:hypothetical protein